MGCHLSDQALGSALLIVQPAGHKAEGESVVPGAAGICKAA